MFVLRTDLPDWLVSRPIAHRGLHENSAGVPENSLASLRACLTAGCPIETDVRLLADGRLAVIHDRTFQRMTGQPGRVQSLRSADMKGLTLLGTRERVPLFSEVLDVVAGAVPLLIDIKCESLAVQPIMEAVIQELAGYSGPHAVQSFNPLVLRSMYRRNPQVPRVLLSGWKLGTSLTGIARPNMLCQEVHWLNERPVQRARRHGMPVMAWVVRDAATLQTATLLADNYVFEESPNFPKPEGASGFLT